jgi:hypothetical protein
VENCFQPKKELIKMIKIKKEDILEAQNLCREAIEKYLGLSARERFREKRNNIKRILDDFREETGLNSAIQRAILIIDKEEEV